MGVNGLLVVIGNSGLICDYSMVNSNEELVIHRVNMFLLMGTQSN